MFLHVGNNKNIREKRIIGIFDMDNSTVSVVTRKFLSRCQKNGAVESASDEIPKSFILYDNEKNESVCFSPLSTSSLFGRTLNTKNK